MPEVTMFVAGTKVPILWFECLMASLAYTKLGFSENNVFFAVVKVVNCEEDHILMILSKTGEGPDVAFAIDMGHVPEGMTKAECQQQWVRWADFWNSLPQSERLLCWQQSKMYQNAIPFCEEISRAMEIRGEEFPERAPCEF